MLDRWPRLQAAGYALALMTLGAFMLEWSVFEPLAAAAAGAAVRLGVFGPILGPGVLVLGLVILVGSVVWKRGAENSVLLVVGTVAIGVGFAAGIALRVWLKAHLRALGYEL